MKKKILYLYLIGAFVVVIICLMKKQPIPSVESIVNSGCLIDNRKYCGWNIFIRDDTYLLVYNGTDTFACGIDKGCDDILYPHGQYDSMYHVAYSLYKDLSLMATALNSEIDGYATSGDSCGHLLFARMDFYNKCYDTNITLFQIDSACFSEHDMANRFKLKSIAKDWYTRERRQTDSYDNRINDREQ